MSRRPLTAARIVRAAARLIDRDGIEALTMRRLAADLGVEAMSLYHHVGGRAAVLDGVAELVLGRIDLAGATRGGWERRIRALARAFRAAALAHPRAFPLVLTRQLGSREGLARSEAALAVLRGAGFGPAAAVHILRTFLAFQTGSLLRELGASPALSGASAAGAAARRAELEASGFPAVAGVAEHLAVCRHEEEYEFGIELLLVALRRLRGSRTGRPKSAGGRRAGAPR